MITNGDHVIEDQDVCIHSGPESTDQNASGLQSIRRISDTVNIVESGDQITTEALGRHFDLGMLYDCRKDQLIAGVTLWDKASLEEHLDERDFEQADATYLIENDNISEKLGSLNLKGDMKIGILSGLFDISGSAEYFNNVQKSSEVVRMALKYESRSKYRQLTMAQLGPDHMQYTGHVSKGMATHIVTGIVYGADAYFVFEQTKESSSRDRKMEANMKSTLEKLKKFGISGAGELSVSNGNPVDKREAESIRCQFIGDFKLTECPQTAAEAIDVMKSLPSKISEIQLVPKIVYLYPLNKLFTEVPELYQQIKDVHVETAQMYFQKLRDFKTDAETLGAKTICHRVQFLENEIHCFKETVDLAEKEVKTRLKQLIPQIRGGMCDENQLAMLFERLEGSSFSYRNLKHIFDDIKNVVLMFESFMQEVSRYPNVHQTFGDDFNQYATRIDAVVVAFNFVEPNFLNKRLEEAYTDLKKRIFKPPEQTNELYKLKKKEALVDLKTFLKYAKEYQPSDDGNSCTREDLYFVITDQQEDEDSGALTSTKVHDAGVPSAINLPTEPGKPQEKDKSTETTVQISWSPPASGSEAVGHYMISIITSLGSSNILLRTINTESSETSILVDKLNPGTEYQFQVQAVTAEGGIVSPFYSSCSDIVKTASDNSRAMRMKQRCHRVWDNNKKLTIYSPTSDSSFYIKSGDAYIRKFEIGSVTSSPTRTALIVGATGTGKTTLLNALFNYLSEIQPENNFRLKLVTQEDEGFESCQSHTRNVSVFKIYNSVTSFAYNLNIIDTPGYGDTDGLPADENATGLIKLLFEERQKFGIDSINMVCFVVKASDTRLTSMQQYIFNRVMVLFGQNMLNSIVFAATFADASEPPVSLVLREAGFLKDPDSLLKFNNSAIFEGPCLNDAQMHFWHWAQLSFPTLLKKLEQMPPVDLEQSANVLRKRRELKDQLKLYHDRVKLQLDALTVMKQEALILNQAKTTKEMAAKDIKHKVHVPTTKKKDVDARIKTTNCTKCESTCHEACQFEGSWVGKYWCKCFGWDGYCRSCEVKNGAKCVSKDHKHENHIYFTEMVVEERTNEEIYRKYKDAGSLQNSKDEILENLAKNFVEQHEGLARSIKKIHDTLEELNKIAAQPDYLSDVDYIDTLIQEEQQTKKFQWKERISHLIEQKELVKQLENAKNPQFGIYKQEEENCKESSQDSGIMQYIREKLTKWWSASKVAPTVGNAAIEQLTGVDMDSVPEFEETDSSRRSRIPVFTAVDEYVMGIDYQFGFVPF